LPLPASPCSASAPPLGPPPTTTAIARPRSGLYSRLFAVLFLRRRRRRSCLEATIWAHNYPSDLLGTGGLLARGRPKTKSVTPVVGGWVRVRKKDGVRFIFPIFFYRVFELPSPRNAQKRDKQNSRINRFWIFGRFFFTNFSIFFAKRFFVVFLNSHR
jgi:hypothetical protein